MKKIRILIADDHAFLRMGLKTYISCKNDLECIGEADNGLSAVELAKQHKPDIVIMDLMMPELNGVEATRLIHEALPKTGIVILTSYGSSDRLAQAMAAGAAGAVFKDTNTDNLINTIRKVAAGEKVMPINQASGMPGNTGVPRLSIRQREILEAFAHGLSNIDIGRQLGISELTVKKHISILFSKLGVANRTEAIAFALSKNLLTI